MGYANNGYQQANLFASREELETPLLDDPPLPLHRHQNPNSSLNSILQPPSYADAVFRTNTSGVPSSSSTKYLRISVSEPLKQKELSNSLVPGGNTYYTYLITTRTNMAHFRGTEFSARRRFKEVVTSDRLSESFRGFIIQIRPDKGVVEGQKQEFVEQRKEALEKYLRRLAEHPAIKRSEELRVFLEVQGRLPLGRTTDVGRGRDGAVRLPRQLLGAAVDVNEVAQPAKGGRDLLRILKELKQSVANDWAGRDRRWWRRILSFWRGDRSCRSLSSSSVMCLSRLVVSRSGREPRALLPSPSLVSAELLVNAQQDIGETMGKLGLAFVKMIKFETVEAAKLHEYLGVMLAVNNDRSSALLTGQTLLSDLSSLNSQIEKLGAASSNIFGGDRSRIHKIEELKDTVRVTEDAKSCALREYERLR
ncbi:sorting nexin 2A [Actinidia rufa]|uniref:Sorting nexin 2A n=1 Tax=Actinidia rufa TaxID=165716 RepID=A0A7J0DEK1_9ERIC|nr:sorting nexin 2A [Actinidia rufa]